MAGTSREASTRAERRMGFTPLPIRCPHCSRRFRHWHVALHGGVLRCEGCERLQYVLLFTTAQVAWLADVTSDEVVEMYAAGCSVTQALERLGALALVRVA